MFSGIQVCLKVSAVFWFFMCSSQTILADNKQGRIQFRRFSQSFGKVIRGEKLTHEFRFVNGGQRPLKIQGVHVSCGCQVVEYDSLKEYQPQEEGVIKVTFDTSWFQGSTAKAVTVMTNERVGGTRVLTMKADIISEYFLDPPVLDFGRVERNKGVKKSIKLRPVNNFNLIIEKIEHNKNLYSTIVHKKSDGVWQIDLVFKSPSQVGYFNDEIAVHTNSKALPLSKILIRADIKGEVSIVPRYIEFGSIAKEKVSTRYVELSSQEEGGLSTKSIRLLLNGELVKNPQNYIAVNPKQVLQNSQNIEIRLKNMSEYAGSVHGTIVFEKFQKPHLESEVDFYAFFK